MKIIWIAVLDPEIFAIFVAIFTALKTACWGVNWIVQQSPLCCSLLLLIYHIFLNHKNHQEWPLLVCFPPYMAFSAWGLKRLYNQNKIICKKGVMCMPILAKTDWLYLAYNRRNSRCNFRIFPPSVEYIARGNWMFWRLENVFVVWY